MARRVWVLVEWVDENNVFPSYEVVNVDTFSYKESDLQPGEQIYISLKHNEPRRAKIIRISNDKRQVKEHKGFLERQDQQVKNVLQMCMRTIKEMKSDQYPNTTEGSRQLIVAGQQNGKPTIITANSENSASDSDSEIQTSRSNVTKYINQSHRQNKRVESSIYRKKGTQTPTINPRCRSIISSTPLPEKNVPENIKLCFDQGTQTDNDWMQPSAAKIEKIELVLKHLYGRFQSLIMKVNKNGTNGTFDVLPNCEQNGEVSFIEQNANESWVAKNHIEIENVEIDNTVESNNENIVGTVEEPNNHAENQSTEIQVQVKTETDRKCINESTRVRRMSAQTTYSNEMVPIGDGHATVPARLLNEIDWKSHTTATRQLLQAIFPRKVLATHSLTGKQSPAHLNKPAKKLLDPKLVDDIVLTVSSRSGVSKNLVRNTITVKCTDEAKLYRNRQRCKFERSQKNRQNYENVPPVTSHSSDESSHFVT